jgi:hypothetical protein
VKAKQLKEQCNQIARSLDLPPAWSVPDLESRLSALSGRQVHIDFLPPNTTNDAPCGLWVSTAAADYIYARHGTSVLHQKHFVLHEVGHMICGHQGIRIDLTSGLATMLPRLKHLKPELVRRALTRTTYSNPQEREAELFADLLYHYSTRGNHGEQETDKVARRAGGALGVSD